MRALVFVSALVFGVSARAAGFPAYLPLPPPVKIKGDVDVENYGQFQFTLRDKTEVVRGKTWKGFVDASALGGPEDRRVLGQLADAMTRAGWEVMLRDEPSNPPLATFKRVREGRETWASTEGWPPEMTVIVVERGAPTVKLLLEPPAPGSEKAAPKADFPFLKRFPGSQLLESSADIKSYKVGPDTGRLEVIVVYREALKAAGWEIVEENTAITTADPNLTARYAKGGLDLWVRIRSQGEGYTAQVGTK